MKLITRQTQANGAAKRWKLQYRIGTEREFSNPIIGHSGNIYRNLVALGDRPDPDKVDAVIGNDLWTDTPACSECGADRVPVLEVGEEPDYDSHTAWLCRHCVYKALAYMEDV